MEFVIDMPHIYEFPYIEASGKHTKPRNFVTGLKMPPLRMADETDPRLFSFSVWMQHQGLNLRQVAVRSGVHYNTLRSWAKGPTRDLKARYEQMIADEFGFSIEEIFVSGAQKSDARSEPLRENDADLKPFTGGKNITSQSVRITHIVPVLGVAEAGAWREMVESSEYSEVVECELPEYRGVTLHGIYVEGESINLWIPNGGRAVWVDTDNAIGGLQQDDYVIARRPNGAGQYEQTIKQLSVRDDGTYELWPRSTDPRHQEPYIIPARDEHAQDGVTIVGVVVERRAPRHRRSGVPVRQSETAA